MPMTIERKGADRRKYLRVDAPYVLRCERAIDTNLPDSVVESVTKNVSASGVVFESRVPFNKGDSLRIILNLPGLDGNSERLCLRCVVARVEMLDDWSYDIAVAFTGTDGGIRWKLMKHFYDQNNGEK